MIVIQDLPDRPRRTMRALDPSTAAETSARTGQHTASTTERKSFRRGGRLVAAAAVLMAATVGTAPTAVAAASDTAPAGAASSENTAARAAVLSLTSPNQATTTIPADFAATFGYQPTIEQGLLVNPDGDCSSPVPLPSEFDITCKAHDLGYDLLRYADAHHQPLTAWARQSLDATLEDRMHAACTTRTSSITGTACQAMASIATTFVDLNSRRQEYGPPVHESLFSTPDSEPEILAATALPLLGSALAFAGFSAVRSRRRPNHIAAQEFSA